MIGEITSALGGINAAVQIGTAVRILSDAKSTAADRLRADAILDDILKIERGFEEFLGACDNPVTEGLFTGWLETHPGRSAQERKIHRSALLRRLGDTTERQVLVGVMDGLLTIALIDVGEPPAGPQAIALALHADIRKSIRNSGVNSNRQRAKTNAIPIIVFSIREKGNLARVLARQGTQTTVQKGA